MYKYTFSSYDDNNNDNNSNSSNDNIHYHHHYHHYGYHVNNGHYNLLFIITNDNVGAEDDIDSEKADLDNNHNNDAKTLNNTFNLKSDTTHLFNSKCRRISSIAKNWSRNDQ